MEVSGRKVEIVCEPCGDNGQKLSAVGFCVDCCEFLCSLCYQHHCRARPFRNHVLQDKDTMPRTKPDSTKTQLVNIADKCLKHQGEIIKYYCRSDRQLGCGSCMITNHRRCEQLLSIEEEYAKIDKEITDFGVQIDMNLQTKDQNNTAIEIHHSKAVKEIKLLIEDIKQYFENLENKMISDVDKIKDHDKKKLDSISATCTTLKNDLQSLASDLSNLHQTQQNGKLFTKMEEARYQMKAITKDIYRLSNENKVEKYTFVPVKQIEDLFKSVTALGNLGIESESNTNDKIEIIESSDEIHTSLHETGNTSNNQKLQLMPNQYKKIALSSSASSSPAATRVTTDIQQYSFKPRQISKVSDVTVQSSKYEKTPWVTGIVLQPDDQLILVDRDNAKVKLVNTKQNKIVTQLKLSSIPWDITTVNNNQVVITMPDANKIQLLSVTRSNISQGQIIKVKGQCQCIVHIDGRFIVTYTDPAKIEMMSITGEVLKIIDKGPNGELLFVNPKFIAINPDNKHVYISDTSKHTVTCMTLDGKVKDVYKNGSLKCPKSLTVDKSGSIYVVCGSYPYTYIHQISDDCSQGQELQGSRLGGWTWSITYCNKEDKLYVGYNTIKVFQLKKI